MEIDELLLVSFGSGQNKVRGRTLDAVAQAMADAFPDCKIRQAFTGELQEVLEQERARGVRRLILQPTHLTRGLDYERILDAAAPYAGRFASLRVGAPLLGGAEDLRTVADALVEKTEPYDDGGTAICFMAHGSRGRPNTSYFRLQELWGGEPRFLGLLNGRPNGRDLLRRVQAGPYRRVVLHPLLLTAGGHALRDMAGGGADSWKTIFTGAGYPVECVLQGLGEWDAVQKLFIAHAKASVQLSRRPGAHMDLS